MLQFLLFIINHTVDYSNDDDDHGDDNDNRLINDNEYIVIWYALLISRFNGVISVPGIDIFWW